MWTMCNRLPVSPRQLQGILLGHISFADLKRQRTLSSDQFAGHNYQVFAFALCGLPQSSYGPSHFVALLIRQKPAGANPPAPKARTSFDSAGTLVETVAKPAAEPPKKQPKKQPKKKQLKKKEPVVDAAATASSKPSGKSSTAVVTSQPGGRHFVRPRPGKNGGVPGALEGKRFVLTGTFPELGGGASLNIGKDRMKVSC